MALTTAPAISYVGVGMSLKDASYKRLRYLSLDNNERSGYKVITMQPVCVCVSSSAHTRTHTHLRPSLGA